MRFFMKLVMVAGLSCISFSAFAGKFTCSSYGNEGCAEHISDIVTDKFTAKFPNTKYEIVVIYEYQRYTNGGGVGYAVAGVAPKVSESKKYGDLSLMPIKRFSSTQRDTGEEVDPEQRAKFEVDLLRDAVQSMMDACDEDANCNILKLK